MSTILLALSTWLHTLATIVMVGHFIFVGLIYLPVLERCMQKTALRDALEQVSARLRPYFGGSLLIFIVTGTHLMLINDSYQGLGNFFASSWSSLIVIKHFLVPVFLALAIFSERAYMEKISDQKPEALKQFKLALNINIFLGLAILLLTAIAQSA
jgi:uncharacterized membrane protein